MKTGEGFRLKRRRLMAAFVAFLMCFTILVGTVDGGNYVQGAGDSINDGYTSRRADDRSVRRADNRGDRGVRRADDRGVGRTNDRSVRRADNSGAGETNNCSA